MGNHDAVLRAYSHLQADATTTFAAAATVTMTPPPPAFTPAAAGVKAAAGDEEGVKSWLQAVPLALPLQLASLACASFCGFEFTPTFACFL